MCLAYIQTKLARYAFGSSGSNKIAQVLPVAALALSGLLSAPVQAEECLAPAPGINHSNYYLLESSNLAPSERQLEVFATMLSGRWWGKQLEVICDTENGKVFPVSDNYKIAAEFNEHFQGALRMEAERENREAVKLTTIWFSPMYRKHRKGHELGWRTYDLTMPDSRTMIFNEKYRVTNQSNNIYSQRGQGFADDIRLNPEVDPDLLTTPLGPDQAGFVRIIQDIKKLSLKADSTLTIERKIYVSGRLVSEEGWILERDYFGSLSR